MLLRTSFLIFHLLLEFCGSTIGGHSRIQKIRSGVVFDRDAQGCRGMSHSM